MFSVLLMHTETVKYINEKYKLLSLREWGLMEAVKMIECDAKHHTSGILHTEYQSKFSILVYLVPRLSILVGLLQSVIRLCGCL